MITSREREVSTDFFVCFTSASFPSCGLNLRSRLLPIVVCHASLIRKEKTEKNERERVMHRSQCEGRLGRRELEFDR